MSITPTLQAFGVHSILYFSRALCNRLIFALFLFGELPQNCSHQRIQEPGTGGQGDASRSFLLRSSLTLSPVTVVDMLCDGGNGTSSVTKASVDTETGWQFRGWKASQNKGRP